MKDNFQRFIVGQAAIIIRDNKCLIVQFSNSGRWGLPGGRIDKRETGKEALKREIKEELGLDNFEYLGIADYDFNYYEREGNLIAKCNLINLIKNDTDELIFSSEHSDFKWIGEDEIKKYDFVWDNIERIIKNSFRYKKILEKNEKK